MRAEIKDGYIKIYDSYLYKESRKEIQGRFFDAEEKAWCVPLTVQNVATIKLLGAELSAELQELDKGDNTVYVPEDPIVPPPINGTLYQHQVRAFNFALKTLGVKDGKQ